MEVDCSSTSSIEPSENTSSFKQFKNNGECLNKSYNKVLTCKESERASYHLSTLEEQQRVLKFYGFENLEVRMENFDKIFANEMKKQIKNLKLTKNYEVKQQKRSEHDKGKFSKL